MDCPPVKVYTQMKIGEKRNICKIEFEGHTYILLKNGWPGCSDNLIHDPDCKCKIKTGNDYE